MSGSQEKVKELIVVGGGTAGWVAVTYLRQSLDPNVHITLIESPTIPTIGVGEATVPTIKTEFFDRLGLKEEDWMPHVYGTYKLGIKYVNWKTAPQNGGDYYYHVFGEIPLMDEIPLTAVWIKKRLEENFQKPLAYACFSSIFALDDNRSPLFFDGKQVQHYAYHFDAGLLTIFLKEWSKKKGITHVIDNLVDAELDEQGNIKCVVSDSGKKYAADLFVDCSGFHGFLIDKVLHEPTISFGDSLLTDRALALQLPYEDSNKTIIPSYTKATALKAGWMWEIPLFSRTGNGYVYSSKYISDDEAEKELRQALGKRAEQGTCRKIKFESRRRRHSWVKNCVSIGLASSFLEPLESTTIYFIYGALYQLVRNFPNKNIDPTLRDKFNQKTSYMVDDVRDFIIMHFATAQREDTAFWRANRHEIKIPDTLQQILDRQKAGLPIKVSTQTNSDLYSTFKSQFENFWTDTNYQSILCGVGVLPYQSYPLLNYRHDILERGNQYFKQIEKEAKLYAKTLPTHHEYLRELYRKSENKEETSPAAIKKENKKGKKIMVGKEARL
jgi:tryptophan 7-halogenase